MTRFLSSFQKFFNHKNYTEKIYFGDYFEDYKNLSRKETAFNFAAKAVKLTETLKNQ